MPPITVLSQYDRTWSTINSSGAVSRRRRATAGRQSSASQSSLSTNQTYSPRARSSPMLRASPNPTFSGRDTTVTRGSRAAYSAKISPLLSGEQSSTPITSMSVNGCPRIESRHSRR